MSLNRRSPCSIHGSVTGPDTRAPRRTISECLRPVCAATMLSTLLLAAVGCGGAESDAQPDGADRPPARVDTVLVSARDIRETVSSTGTLRSVETVELRSEVAGPVRSIHFAEGERVQKGQLLVSIERVKIEDQLDAATAARAAQEARAELARATHRRVHTLYERGSASQEELDEAASDSEEAEAMLGQLDAEISLLEEQLADTEVRAPVDGRISLRLVDTGDLVQVGTPLATLYTLDPLEVVAQVPDRILDRVHLGQEVRARVSAFPDRVFTGTITFISPAVDEGSRMFPVKAEIANTDEVLKPGSFAAVAITLELREGRPMIPEECLVSTRQGYIVYVVVDGTARRRNVEIGLREPGIVEILSGLEVGETVVRAGQMTLSDGDPVTARTAETSTPSDTGTGS